MRPDQAVSNEEAHDRVRAWLFGRYRLDLDKQLFFCDDETIALRPKSFDVLTHLVQNANRAVSRDELFDAVWPDRVVTDDSLTQCLIEIRTVLGDEKRTLIQTIPRRGYLFDGEVTTEESPSAQAENLRVSGKENLRLPSPWTTAALVVLAIAVAFTWWRTDTLEQETVPSAADWEPPPASIAVLPFADMSEEGDKQYLAEGISEEILNLLAQSPGLTVIARTSSFSLKDSNLDINTIARKLNVAHVLEGSVRQAGDHVRITAQLIEGATGVHIWSETFDDQLLDVFALQDRIAVAVAAVLRFELTPNVITGSESIAHTPNPKAWEAYLRGQFFYDRRGEGDIMRAQRSFEEAVDIDPQFANAWVALSATFNQRRAGEEISDEERLSSEEAFPIIRDALEKALAINPNHPEALWRLSGFYYKTDPGKAIELIKRGMEMGRNQAIVPAMMGGFALQSGDLDLAISFLQHTATLDPLSASNSAGLGHAKFLAGDIEAAEVLLIRSIELNPTGSEIQRMYLAWIKIIQGELSAAAELAETLTAGPDLDMTMAILSHLRVHTATTDEALERLLAGPPAETADELAQVYAMMGDRDEAFRWLLIATDSIANSTPGYNRKETTKLQYSPFLVPLHEDPRWAEWWSIATSLQLTETDYQVLDILTEHLELHQEIYQPIGADSGSG